MGDFSPLHRREPQVKKMSSLATPSSLAGAKSPADTARARGLRARQADVDAAAPRSAYILEIVASELAEGRIAPGTRLEEAALCKRFGTSRTPVREAVRQLAARGLVEIRPRKGAFAVQLTVDRLAQVFETMGFMEAACAALAARRHTAEDRQALASAHEECVRAAEAEDPDRFYAANNRLHECIYRASHNAHLEGQTLELRDKVEFYRRAATFHPGLMALSIREHATVIEAILAMDEPLAAARMRQHLDTLRDDAVSMATVVTRRRLAG
jgi:DNA-binding GntR family transcriptional regulator